jgi:hypothetical protein
LERAKKLKRKGRDEGECRTSSSRHDSVLAGTDSDLPSPPDLHRVEAALREIDVEVLVLSMRRFGEVWTLGDSQAVLLEKFQNLGVAEDWDWQDKGRKKDDGPGSEGLV